MAQHFCGRGVEREQEAARPHDERRVTDVVGALVQRRPRVHELRDQHRCEGAQQGKWGWEDQDGSNVHGGAQALRDGPTDLQRRAITGVRQQREESCASEHREMAAPQAGPCHEHHALLHGQDRAGDVHRPEVPA